MAVAGLQLTRSDAKAVREGSSERPRQAGLAHPSSAGQRDQACHVEELAELRHSLIGAQQRPAQTLQLRCRHAPVRTAHPEELRSALAG
jgi:hypothetical protein